ncbi:uncharacterized protein LOC124448860 isoform X2 [Xenia sp. Carnegie-2017]|uniref:uncharacterized protein LOC124448860 isoform X2 n=1 Tax=Xenia sp. Carnegie-2017 TaxID=2897299 RepID=UPI001F04B1F5|nr:uncharacterized protein LOC124448860 isoform X2 [Xenia sp. Carnegie-2017]
MIEFIRFLFYYVLFLSCLYQCTADTSFIRVVVSDVIPTRKWTQYKLHATIHLSPLKSLYDIAEVLTFQNVKDENLKIYPNDISNNNLLLKKHITAIYNKNDKYQNLKVSTVDQLKNIAK